MAGRRVSRNIRVRKARADSGIVRRNFICLNLFKAEFAPQTDFQPTAFIQD